MTCDRFVWRCVTLLTGELAGPLLAGAGQDWAALNTAARHAAVHEDRAGLVAVADTATSLVGPFPAAGCDGLSVFAETLSAACRTLGTPGARGPLVTVLRRAARHAAGGGCLAGVLVADGTDPAIAFEAADLLDGVMPAGAGR